MKKLLVLLLAFLFVFLCSCESGEEKNNGNETTGEQSVVESESKNVNETENTPESETVADTSQPETEADTTVLETDTPDPNKEREVTFKYSRVSYKEVRPPLESSPVYEVYKTYEEFEKFLQLDCFMEYLPNSVKDSIKEWYGKTEQEFFETHNIIWVRVNGFSLNKYTGDDFYVDVNECTVTEDKLKISLTNQCDAFDRELGVLVFISKKDMRNNIEIEHIPHEYSDKFVEANYVTQMGVRYYTRDSWGAPMLSYADCTLDSIEDLSRWVEKNQVGYDYTDPVYPKSIPDIVSKYDEKFFEDNYLYIYEYGVLPDNTLEVVKLTKNSGYLIIDIVLSEELNHHSGYVDENTKRVVCLLVEIPKKDFLSLSDRHRITTNIVPRHTTKGE